MNTYHQMTPPEDLSPNEQAEVSRPFSMTDVTNVHVRAHFDGLHDELRTGVRHTCFLCTEVKPTCETCKKSVTGTWGGLRTKGWIFDVDGRDFCERCDPYRKMIDTNRDSDPLSSRTAELKQAISLAEGRLPAIGEEINFDELMFGGKAA